MEIEDTIVLVIEKKQLTGMNVRFFLRKRERPKLESQKTIQKSMSERKLPTKDCEGKRGWNLGVG